MARPLSFGERLARSLGIKHRRESAFAADIRRFEEQSREFGRDVRALERDIKREAREAALASGANRALLQAQFRANRRVLRNVRGRAATAGKKLSRSTAELARSIGAPRTPTTAKGRASLIERAAAPRKPHETRLEWYARRLEREYGEKHPRIRARFLALPIADQQSYLRERDELHQEYVDNGRENLGLQLNPFLAYH
jgi:hypothetical protein